MIFFSQGLEDHISLDIEDENSKEKIIATYLPDLHNISSVVELQVWWVKLDQHAREIFPYFLI